MTTPTTHKPTGKSQPGDDAVSYFIKKTYELLEDEKFLDIVDWNADGTAFVIKKPTEFGQKVLPTYFKHSNLTSFVRQLNMYGFHKRRTKEYDHVYIHNLFRKGNKLALRDIKRKNQENALVHIQKAIETLQAVQGKQKVDSNTNVYENQLLKKLNKDALVRISSLENKVKELTIQNQALWSQISHQNQKEDLLVSFLANFMKTKGITLDQLPTALKSQFSNSKHAETFENFKNGTIENNKKQGSILNVSEFLNVTSDDSCNSTEVPSHSPLSISQTNSDRYIMNQEQFNMSFNMTEPQMNTAISYPTISFQNQVQVQFPQQFEQGSYTQQPAYFKALNLQDGRMNNEANNSRKIFEPTSLLNKRPINFEDESINQYDTCRKKEMLNNPYMIHGIKKDEHEFFRSRYENPQDFTQTFNSYQVNAYGACDFD